jgi:hypothetical protein
MNTNTTLKPVDHLETMLRIWEETLLRCQAMFTLLASRGQSDAVENLVGSVIHWSQFRKSLLAREPFDHDRFFTPEYVVDGAFMRSPIFSMLPRLIYDWCMESRRVYDLSVDLQRSLELTSIGQITWKDITAPFPVFGISLPIGVPWSAANIKGVIDFVLVEVSTAGIRLTTFDGELYGRRFMDPKRRHRVMRAIRNKDLGMLRAIMHGTKDGDFAIPTTQLVAFPTDDRPIMEDLENMNFDTTLGGEAINSLNGNEKLPDYWRLVIRLVVGLCLHLEMAGKSHGDREIIAEPWKRNGPKRPPTLDESAITDEAMVCAVKLVSPLTSEETNYHERIRSVGIESATRELSTHFRRTYWRRRPGTGDDPSAPKCVKVRWTWVNKHRLPENALPVGSEVLVK